MGDTILFELKEMELRIVKLNNHDVKESSIKKQRTTKLSFF